MLIYVTANGLVEKEISRQQTLQVIKLKSSGEPKYIPL